MCFHTRINTERAASVFKRTQLNVTFISFIYHSPWCRNTVREVFAYCCIRRSFVCSCKSRVSLPTNLFWECWGECYTRAIIILCCNNHSGFITHRTFPSIPCTADKLTQWQCFMCDKKERASALRVICWKWVSSNFCVHTHTHTCIKMWICRVNMHVCSMFMPNLC